MRKNLLWKILNYFDNTEEVAKEVYEKTEEVYEEPDELAGFRQPVKEIILGIRRGDWDASVFVLNGDYNVKLAHSYLDLKINIITYKGRGATADATWLYDWEVDAIIKEVLWFTRRIDKAFKEVEDARNIKKFMALIDEKGELK